jgi:glycosyltransferase involved in cell wall biosynthesis
MKKINNSKKVSVVVCAMNCEKIISSCLKSILKNNPLEIIVVDGLSNDNTKKNALKFKNVKVFSDEGKGLAYARRLGAEKAKGKYILYVGPDNIMNKTFISKFVDLKMDMAFDAACVQTRVYAPKNFWDYGLDFRWKCLMGKPGLINVVGTPSLYNAKIFSKIKFSSKDLGSHDDTDLSEQLRAKGFRLGLVPLLVYDQNNCSAISTWNKFKWYGTGDYFFYKKYHEDWTIGRRIISISHPLIQTLKFSLKAILAFNATAFLWLFYTMLARYYGWLNKYYQKKFKQE